MAETRKPASVREAGGRVVLAFAGLFILNLLLRAFYLRYDFVNGDEGIRALTAARMLDGARLYVDIVTDKPPGTTLFYAGVFALFGKSMAAVHLAAAVWNFLTSIILYRVAARLYSKTAGLWAALFFVYFTTNYLTADMMAANTELLMALPYTASLLFFTKSWPETAPSSTDQTHVVLSRVSLLTAGGLAGVAMLFKQVGLFNLVFFTVFELLDSYHKYTEPSGRFISRARAALLRSFGRLVWIALGFAAVLGLLAAWLVATGAVESFYRYVIQLGRFYVGSVPTNLWLKFMVGRTLSYVLFNASLWALAAWVGWRAFRNFFSSKQEGRADLALALWGVVSLLGVFTSGRFFGHYFIQVLPALCLLAARGADLLAARLRQPEFRPRARLGVAILVMLSLFSFVRFHHRTAVLAYETVSGSRTRWSASWGMTRREQEAEVVAARVLERIGPGDPLYIWDYALDVYWLSGCPPASRFVAPYYVTGKFPATAEMVGRDSDRFWSETRAVFVDDLARVRPRLILDVYGKMLELPYPEVVEFLRKNYQIDGSIGPDPERPFVVLRLRGQ